MAKAIQFENFDLIVLVFSLHCVRYFCPIGHLLSACWLGTKCAKPPIL